MERRQHPRVVRPFEGTWRGASGATRCRIGDISLGGCFVECMAMPGQGESTVVTVVVGDHQFSFSGQVIHVEPAIGFSVRFDDLQPQDGAELARLLATLDPGRASA